MCWKLLWYFKRFNLVRLQQFLFILGTWRQAFPCKDNCCVECWLICEFWILLLPAQIKPLHKYVMSQTSFFLNVRKCLGISAYYNSVGKSLEINIVDEASKIQCGKLCKLYRTSNNFIYQSNFHIFCPYDCIKYVEIESIDFSWSVAFKVFVVWLRRIIEIGWDANITLEKNK